VNARESPVARGDARVSCRPVREEDLDWMLAPLPSGRHGLPRELVARSQRLRLLNATIAVAGAEGYAATTVTAVIARANVSRKTFYEQFADKEDCFLAAYELVVERARAGILEAYAVEAPWTGRVRAALAWALDALAAHPHEARIAFIEVLTAGPRARERRDLALRDLASLFAPGFEAAPAGAGVPASTPTAVAGALSELIAARIRRGGAEQLPQLLPDLLYCTLAPFVGPVAAAEALAPPAAASRAGSACG
jgi:AcrR family transcriptional regulator